MVKYGSFSNSRAGHNRSYLIRTMIELIKDIMVTKILTKFGADLFIYVDAIVQTKSISAIFPYSRANNSGFSGPIGPIMKLI